MVEHMCDGWELLPAEWLGCFCVGLTPVAQSETLSPERKDKREAVRLNQPLLT